MLRCYGVVAFITNSVDILNTVYGKNSAATKLRLKDIMLFPAVDQTGQNKEKQSDYRSACGNTWWRQQAEKLLTAKSKGSNGPTLRNPHEVEKKWFVDMCLYRVINGAKVQKHLVRAAIIEIWKGWWSVFLAWFAFSAAVRRRTVRRERSRSSTSAPRMWVLSGKVAKRFSCVILKSCTLWFWNLMSCL